MVQTNTEKIAQLAEAEGGLAALPKETLVEMLKGLVSSTMELETQVGKVLWDMEVCKMELEEMKQENASQRRAVGANTRVAPRRKVPEPGTFTGVRSAKEVEDFLWDMEVYFQSAQIPEEEQALVGAAFLTGDAKLWWCTQAAPNLLGEQQTPQLSWGQFKTELKKQFIPENSSWAAREVLFELKHTGNIREYVEKYTALMFEIDNMAEKDRLYHFLAGLQPWAQTELQRQKSYDLEGSYPSRGWTSGSLGMG